MIGMVGSCFGILIALAFIGVGASVVRAAKPQSGYLMVAAGVLELLTTCCASALFSQPMRVTLLDSGVDAEAQATLYLVFGVVSLLVDLVVGVLLALSIVGLAKAARQAKPS
jgi:hypothetical protein